MSQVASFVCFWVAIAYCIAVWALVLHLLGVALL